MEETKIIEFDEIHQELADYYKNDERALKVIECSQKKKNRDIKDIKWIKKID